MQRRELIIGTLSVSLFGGCLRQNSSTTPTGTPPNGNPPESQPTDEPPEGAQTSEPLQQIANDWPQLGFDAAHTSFVSADVGPESVENSQTGLSGAVDETIVIYDDQLFSNGVLYDLPISESDDGTEITTGATGALIYEDTLYTSSTASSGKAEIQAFDAGGNSLWQTELESQDNSDTFHFGSPVAADGILCQATGDARVHAVDTDTGEYLWQYDIGEQERLTPAIDSGIIYIPANETVALSTEGEEVWTNAADFASAPTVGDEFIFLLGIADDTRGIHALDPDNGIIQWSTEMTGRLGSADVASIAYDSTTVYANTGDSVAALDPANGTINWETDFDGTGSVTVTANRVYAVGSGSSGGAVAAFNRETGEELWSEIITSPILTEGIVTEGSIYIGAGDGLYVYSESDTDS